jgi:pyridoxal 5'-phosphate synthase pdxT subunit
LRVGILALQGAYAAHQRPLLALGHETKYLRTPADFDGIEGMVLPGGESSVHLALIARFGLEEAIVSLAREGKPILATCAGLILIAREVMSPAQRSLGLLDVRVSRNAYGRQLDSFEGEADETGLPLVFIRAPRITHHDTGVEILATHRGEPVWARQDKVMGATFHPELTGDLRVHRAAFGEEARASGQVR